MKEYDFTDRKLKIAVVLAITMIGWLCLKGAGSAHGQSTPANLSPGVQEVVKLSAARMSDDVILSYIKNSGVSYHLSADDILYLNSQGVSQPVISALLKAAPDGTPLPAPAPTPTPPAGAPPPALALPTTPAPAMTAPPPAPSPGSEVTLSDFQTQLAPYGSWVDVAGYGVCWRPAVEDSEPGWRPYLNAGHWDYTDEGWCWRSDYPWGQYAFHYGRWARDAGYGWVWTPGYEWAPAWVCWRNAEADGYCGWAPLPPGARFEASVGLLWNGRPAVDADFGLGADGFVFVPFDHFWEHDYQAFLAPSWRLPALFRRSILANGYRLVGGHFVVEGLGRDRIALLTHHDVVAGRVDFRDGHFGHGRELDRIHATDFQGGRGPDGRDFHGEGRDEHRGF